MTELQQIALKIMISTNGFKTDDGDVLNENIINATEKAKQFLFMSSITENYEEEV